MGKQLIYPFCGLLVAYVACCVAVEEEMKLQSDLSFRHDWSKDPSNVDHGFIHHKELSEAIRSGEKEFEAFDVFHIKGGEETRHPFLNLGDVHKDRSRLYDTKTTFELEDGKFYVDLDHSSARVHRIDDESMHFCHESIENVATGSYLVGTGHGEWIHSDDSAKWIVNTDHVGPRIKRKLAEGTLSTLGLAISRVVTSVAPLGGKCVEVITKTVHPNSMFESMSIDSYFHAHSAHEASRYNSEHHLEEAMHYDHRRKLNFLVDGNGVQYCDDTVEMNQKPYMTHGYNQWDYSGRKWGWYKGKYDVPDKAGGGEIMYLASLLSNGGSGCFMYMNSLEAFNWNTNMADPSKPKAETNPYILSGSTQSGILCENCFAYLGARVRVVAEFQKKNSEVRFMAFIGGTAAAFAELQLNNYAKSISRSGSFIFPEPENAYKDVALGNTGIKFYWKGGGFGYELDGEIETEGQVRASAGIYADAYIFAAYGGKGGTGETFYVNKSASLDYHPPALTTSSDFSIKKASIKALITGSVNFKLGRSLEVFGKELGLTAVFTSSLRKEIDFALTGTSPAPITDDTSPVERTADAHLVKSDPAARELGGTDETLPVYSPGDKIVIAYEYSSHAPLTDQEVFLSLVTGGQGETPVARKAFTTSESGSGQVTVEFLVPWNRNYQGDDEDRDRACHIILRSSLDDTLAATTENFHILAFTERDSAFTAPASLTAGSHDEELRAGTRYTVRWNKDLFWHYQQEPHQQRHGEHWQAEQVTFELVGETLNGAGEVTQRTSYHDFGVHPNAGYASLIFLPEAVSITQGHRFYLIIKAVRASYLQGWSSGYFRFYQGSDEITGLPLVSIQTMGINAAFRQSSHHKVAYSRTFVSPQDFAVSSRMGRRRLQGPPIDPVGPVNDGADTCNGLVSTDANFGMSGKAGVESLLGSVDFTSNMLSIPIGAERSKCITDITSTDTGDTTIPASAPLDLNHNDIPAHDPIVPVPAPKMDPPPVIVPSPPNATELKGWLVTKIYPDCTTAHSNPLYGQIMMNAEAVGLCIRVGDSGDGSGGVYLMNDIDEKAQEARTWFFSGPKGAQCIEEALISDDSGGIKYQATDMSLGECVKLGSSAQLHYSITTFKPNATTPTADFGTGSGTVYWDQKENCGYQTNITSFSVANPLRCYAVQSIASLDSRQSTCSVNGANTTVRTYFSDTECTSGSNRVVSTIPFKSCAPSHFHTTTFGQTGYLPSADNYQSNFCDSGIPYTEENTGDKGGYSSGGLVGDGGLTTGAIIGIVVMTLTLVMCIGVIFHYAKAKKNPFNLWGDDEHHPGLKNWLEERRASSMRRPSDNTGWLATNDGLAKPSGENETRRSTQVITMEGAYPENRINPLHSSQTKSAPPEV